MKGGCQDIPRADRKPVREAGERRKHGEIRTGTGQCYEGRQGGDSKSSIMKPSPAIMMVLGPAMQGLEPISYLSTLCSLRGIMRGTASPTADVQYDARAEGALQSESLAAARRVCDSGHQRHQWAAVSSPIAEGMPRQGLPIERLLCPF